jgi:molecular chaperone DnaK (HSP70)
VIRVIEEPTAAAVAYDLHKKSNVHHILVYDFGGGTLDVSLLYVAKGSVQVYATDGDDELGGSDLDMCLFEIISSKVPPLLPLSLPPLRPSSLLRSQQLLMERSP